MAIDNGSIYWIGNYQGFEYTEENPLVIKVISDEEIQEITIDIKDSKSEPIKIDGVQIGDFFINSWGPRMGMVYNSGHLLKVTSTISAQLIGVSALLSFSKDYKDGEPIDQAAISSLGGATVGWSASWVIGLGTAKVLGLIGGVVAMPALLPIAIGVIAGLGAGYVGAELGDKANELIDEYIFEEKILVEFGEGVKVNSSEAWNNIKGMAEGFKERIDQGATNIQLKFDDWNGSLLGYLSSEENTPLSNVFYVGIGRSIFVSYSPRSQEMLIIALSLRNLNC